MSESKGVLLKISVEDMTQTLGEFYSTIMNLYMGDEYTSEAMCDCRHIYVSEDVQKMIFEAYTTQNPESYAANPEYFLASVGAKWCIYGPKVSSKLSSGTVQILKGFIVNEEEESI